MPDTAFGMWINESNFTMARIRGYIIQPCRYWDDGKNCDTLVKRTVAEGRSKTLM